MSTDVVADLVQVYSGSVPVDLTSTQYGKDIAFAIASIIGAAHQECARLAAGALAATATGGFLDLHLHDAGIERQDGETDDQAYERLRLPPKAGTVPSIFASVEAIIGTDQFRIIELPLDSMYLDRGFCLNRSVRMGGARGVVIVVIPASANARASISDAVRSKVSGGKLWVVEEYT